MGWDGEDHSVRLRLMLASGGQEARVVNHTKLIIMLCGEGRGVAWMRGVWQTPPPMKPCCDQLFIHLIAVEHGKISCMVQGKPPSVPFLRMKATWEKSSWLINLLWRKEARISLALWAGFFLLRRLIENWTHVCDQGGADGVVSRLLFSFMNGEAQAIWSGDITITFGLWMYLDTSGDFIRWPSFRMRSCQKKWLWGGVQ